MYRKPKHKCITKWCRNGKAQNKNYCYKCRSRRQKEINPIGYYYNALRKNARRRKKEFNLTGEEFKKFCEETNYIELKGRSMKAMCIDRKDHTKGYSADNIQILGSLENSSKGYHEGNKAPF